jgi:hypothetical protein
MLKFEFSKQFDAEYNKTKLFFMLLNDLMVKTLVHSHEVWMQTLMVVYINVYSVYIH